MLQNFDQYQTFVFYSKFLNELYRISCHLSEVKAHYNQTQTRFWKGHSTTTLLLKFRHNIKQAMNTSKVTLIILLDCSQAFVIIDQLTLEKLHKLNFSVQALKLIHSYVSERKQFVQVDDKSSSEKLNQFGVPRGKIFGPVLFNLYIFHWAENVTCDSLQYADDSTLYKHSKPKKILKMYWRIRIWSRNSITMVFIKSLVFNDDKNKLMLFSTTQLTQKHYLNNNKLLK